MKFLVLAGVLVSATLLSAANVGGHVDAPGPGAQVVVGVVLIGLSLIRRSRA